VKVYITSNIGMYALTPLRTYIQHLVDYIYISTMSAKMFKVLYMSVCQVKHNTKYN